MLHIRLLGTFLITYNNEPVMGLTRPQLKTLLVYLVLHRRTPLARTELRRHFWQSTTDGQPKTNLRNLIHYLRRDLPGLSDCIEFGQVISWQQNPRCRVDVAEFEEALQQAASALTMTERQETLCQALSLYTGDLWPECREEWIIPERERLRTLYISALEQLINLLELARDYRGALQAAQRLLHYTPLQEENYRRLMYLYACLADREGIERTFQECRTQLASKLKVAPNLLTRELYERLTQSTSIVQPPMAAFVERHSEWAGLQNAWERAQGGKPHCILLTGDAGMGKTRLLNEFTGTVARYGLAVAATQCHPFTLEVAYAPLLDWLRTPLFQRRIDTLDSRRRAELAYLLPDLHTDQTALPLLAPTLEDWQRQRLYETLAHLFLTPNEPLLLVIDNAQWCDQGTIDWLHYLFHVAPTAKLLLAGALSPLELRPHYPVARLQPRLQQSQLVTELHLTPLTGAGVEALGSALAGHPLTAAAGAQLYGVTQGNPLYVVEALMASGNSADVADAEAIAEGLLRSPLVQATLQLYFASLSTSALDVVGLAATIGHTFSFERLATAALTPRETFLLALDELLQRTIVRDEGKGIYTFGHPLLQRAAYAALSSAKRQLWQERLAQARE